ncbi:Ohr family peroxiredoxin [Nocardia vaccinii]|uniref:Ohr family peroxiredoxin n=1 Tax=Nocardia vaccinii TaxID=1822 RepID=UPI00082D2E28|nr:Ohr family peroxiredoxin [Nocardia vaccinii]
MSDQVKPLYTANAVATGAGRDGHVSSLDKTVDTDLAVPKEMHGAGGLPNPEIFFAAGFAACFHNALRLVARRAKQNVEGSSVAAAVTLGANERGGFELAVVLEVSVPGLDKPTLRELVETTEQVCPYSNAVRGNVPVEVRISA